ncbi:hypothetical protein JR316_0005517 [Psilocybe cubensis]|uniref:Uncharacterized protein n=1 Tax=Psilocybe cubensis TaxID=181762 RepID=A0ACB8GZI7_PSICU|nr:hypothetical protein JR316_0005517 [Psilocybe cubensis]KAH9480999.1 hypothetical protein JR316_0005517 [Psilocybe cubensis]
MSPSDISYNATVALSQGMNRANQFDITGINSYRVPPNGLDDFEGGGHVQSLLRRFIIIGNGFHVGGHGIHATFEYWETTETAMRVFFSKHYSPKISSNVTPGQEQAQSYLHMERYEYQTYLFKHNTTSNNLNAPGSRPSSRDKRLVR